MKTSLALLTVALAAAAAPLAAAAQAASAPETASAPARATSRPSRPPPRPQSVQQQHDAAFPDLRPERPTVPQLTIPLGRPRPPERVERNVPRVPSLRASAAASNVTIGDEAARCEAERSAQARAACRDRLAHQSPRR
jgi:hypothetical protein